VVGARPHGHHGRIVTHASLLRVIDALPFQVTVYVGLHTVVFTGAPLKKPVMMSCIEAPFVRESGPFQVICPGWMSGGGQLPALGLLWQMFSIPKPR
jgi:hypothetical protein